MKKKLSKPTVHCTLFLFALVCSLSIAPTHTSAQTTAPKIGLCLSGGGAKGMAHIGLLRMLDSLGIRPDFITGTSAGAIIGGLYAMGYSGDELKQILINADWPALLSNKIPLRAINIEEKDEYGRYWLEMPMKNWKPSLPRGAIEGAELQEYLIGLTFPARHIHDFDSLPIPFRCVATDINTGRPVLLKTGQLSEALRASMAVPLVFSPIEWDDTLLLIDGGLIRNFPVQEVLDMGATRVIGSFTGFRLLSADELDGGYQIIMQSLGLSMFKSMNADKEACEVLINNELPGLYASSFKDIQAIIAAGEANARAMLPELARIAALQHAGPAPRPLAGLVPLKSIDAQAANEDTKNLLINKMGIRVGQNYTDADLKKGLSTLYGTRFFERILVEIEPTADGKASKIHLRAKNAPQSVFKFGFHYDTDDAAGILLNTTFRNTVLPNSRLSVSFDLAEKPKAHIDFYQFVDRNARLSWFVSGRGERTVRNDYLFAKAPEGTVQSNEQHLSNSFVAASGIHYSLEKNALLSAEIRAANETVKPQNDPRKIPTPNETYFLKNRTHGFALALGGLQNTLNAVFFPHRGQLLQVEGKVGLGYFADYATFDFVDSTQTSQINNTVSARDQTYFRYRIAERYWIPMNQSWSVGLRGDLGAGFTLGNKLPEDSRDTFALDNPETFYIGGSDMAVRPEELAFAGLRKSEINFSQCINLGISARYNFHKAFFITPALNIGRFTDSHASLFNHILIWQLGKQPTAFKIIPKDFQTHILGYSLDIGYHSKLGPINLMVQSNTYSNSWSLFFSIGFKMP